MPEDHCSAGGAVVAGTAAQQEMTSGLDKDWWLWAFSGGWLCKSSQAVSSWWRVSRTLKRWAFPFERKLHLLSSGQRQKVAVHHRYHKLSSSQGPGQVINFKHPNVETKW